MKESEYLLVRQQHPNKSKGSLDIVALLEPSKQQESMGIV